MRKIAFLLLILPFVLFSCGSDESFVEVTPNGGTTTGKPVSNVEKNEVQLIFSSYTAPDIIASFIVTADYLSVDWGDGSPIQEFRNVRSGISHFYEIKTSETHYTIKIKSINMTSFATEDRRDEYIYKRGVFESILFGECSSLRSLYFGRNTMYITDDNFDISKCRNLEELVIDNFVSEKLNLSNNSKLRTLKVNRFLYSLEYLKFNEIQFGSSPELKKVDIGAYSLSDKSFLKLDNLDTLTVRLFRADELVVSYDLLKRLELDIQFSEKISVQNSPNLKSLLLVSSLGSGSEINSLPELESVTLGAEYNKMTAQYISIKDCPKWRETKLFLDNRLKQINMYADKSTIGFMETEDFAVAFFKELLSANWDGVITYTISDGVNTAFDPEWINERFPERKWTLNVVRK